MILDDQIPELVRYRAAERKISVATRGELASLVVFGSNEALPVHRWFWFKEGFSASIVTEVLREFSGEYAGPELRLLDPFCGVGTTLLAGHTLATKTIHSIGIERNPFIHFVAETKLRWPQLTASITKEGDNTFRTAASKNSRLPALSSIREGRCISTYTANKLRSLLISIPPSSPNFDFLRLGIAASIEPLSRIRRDGRALRIVEKPKRNINSFVKARWSSMRQDAELMRASVGFPRGTSSVRLGDGREPSTVGVENDSIDLIVTSPPYPNNIDYSEVYKLELWMLGFISSADEFLKLRRSTLRSHPTFNRKSEIDEEYETELQKGRLKPIVGDLLVRLESTKDPWRAGLLRAYFADLWRAVRNYKKALRKGGIAVLVVGNSLHGTDVPAVIATDLVLAQIAICHGMTARVAIARSLRRRLSGNHFLRGTIPARLAVVSGTGNPDSSHNPSTQASPDVCGLLAIDKGMPHLP